MCLWTILMSFDTPLEGGNVAVFIGKSVGNSFGAVPLDGRMPSNYNIGIRTPPPYFPILDIK